MHLTLVLVLSSITGLKPSLLNLSLKVFLLLLFFIMLHIHPVRMDIRPAKLRILIISPGYPVRLLTPVFMQYGVDAVISGHDEMWERSEISGIEIKPDQN